MHLQTILSKSFFGRAFLFALSLLYGTLLFLRNLFRTSPYRAKLPVISVGNIVAGGTGKTPFTMMLASQIGNVAILTRGYKSKSEHSAGVCVDAQSARADEVGDEACLMAQKVPHAQVYVGKRRVAAARRAEKTDVTCLILDDGFQHRALLRDLDIVLLDCEDPFGGGHLLPLGMLREPLSALKRADLIALNRVDRAEDLNGLKAVIRRYTSAPMIEIKMSFQGFRTLTGEKADLKPQKVGLFCGIGKPEQFCDFVKALGFQVEATQFLGDHEAISETALQELYEQVQAPIVCTEKDAVKLKQCGIPVYAVQAALKVTKGQELLQNMLQNTFAKK